jgi:hypothetical protein
MEQTKSTRYYNYKDEAPEQGALEQAYARSSDYWLPGNPVLLKHLQEGLENGAYDLDIDFLISEIKTDYALFTYCVKELSRMLGGEALKADDNIFEIFRKAGLQRLKQILNKSQEHIFKNSLDSMSEVQAIRLEESMLSASTAEALAERQNIDPEIAFSAALLKQLGMSLVAWNYPNIYKKAFVSQKKGQTLEESINSLLGFSPLMLGTMIAQQWNLPPLLTKAMSPKPASDDLTKDDSADLVIKLCEVGEALARANHPEHYPDAAADWQMAKTNIEEMVGLEGIKIIQKKAQENLENYLKQKPALFANVKDLRPETRIYQHKKNTIALDNVFLKQCPKALRDSLGDFYLNLEGGTIDRENIKKLSREIVPSAGFVSGCIYLIDPTEMTLIPRLSIGYSKLNNYPKMKVRHAPFETDPVAVAYSCGTPIMGERTNLQEKEIRFIAGILGKKQKAGVLYLEISEQLSQRTSNDSLIYFKAIRQAFEDCLKLI